MPVCRLPHSNEILQVCNCFCKYCGVPIKCTERCGCVWERTLMRRVLQFLQPARDFRCDLLVIFLMVPSLSLSPSCSLADGETTLECVNDSGDSCCMFADCLDAASVFNAKRDEYVRSLVFLMHLSVLAGRMSTGYGKNLGRLWVWC